MPRNIKTYFVDGTRDIIMDGRAMVVHVIARERDFTHARIAGFATTERDARLFAASADMASALAMAEAQYQRGLFATSTEEYEATHQARRDALKKAAMP